MTKTVVVQQLLLRYGFGILQVERPVSRFQQVDAQVHPVVHVAVGHIAGDFGSGHMPVVDTVGNVQAYIVAVIVVVLGIVPVAADNHMQDSCESLLYCES